MSDKPKGIIEGPPIWVESLMNVQEWKERVKKYPSSSVPEPPQYNLSKYKGGVWRQGMGATPSIEEMNIRNKVIEGLRKYHLAQLQPQD